MAAGGLMTGGYPSDVSSDLDFFRQSHLSVSKLPSLKDKRSTTIDSAGGGKKDNNKGTFPRTAERSHTYWRIFQHVTVENNMADPKARGVSRITTKRQNKTLYGEYPKEPDILASKPKTASTAFKLPSLDSKLGAKSVYWHWNSLSEDLRKGRVMNFHQLKFDPKNVPLAHGAPPASAWRWERASSKYSYKLSPRYHVQFLEDIHQTRRLGWKGNTKMIKSGKLRPEETEEDEENEEEDEEAEEDFEAALATNISGIDNFDTEGGGTDDILAGLDDEVNDSKLDNLDTSLDGLDQKGFDDEGAKDRPGALEDKEQGLAEIKEIPEPEET